jgi:hypothetical protein
VAEGAARVGVTPKRFRLVLEAAEQLSEAELAVVERLMLRAAGGSSVEERRMVAEGLSRALDAVALRSGVDPLAQVDDPIDVSATAAAVMESAHEVETRRRELLRQCVSVTQASNRIRRSRQAVERLRREGRVLALRVGSQWRYPEWQFEPDAPGGVVPGLGEVLAQLRLSPSGAAFWLTRPALQLGDRAPIEALRRREQQAVVRAAAEHGHMP